MQKTPAHVAAAVFDAVLGADLRGGLGKLRVPTAVLHGRHDAITPLAMGEELAEKIPGATLTVFEDSGHAPFLEEPEAFNEALGRLLEAKSAGAETARATARTARSGAKKRR
jgi:pimeloyl-ACP methyl ester carboxylesterase